MIIKLLFVVCIFFLVRNILKSIAHYNEIKAENTKLKKNARGESVEAEYTVVDD